MPLEMATVWNEPQSPVITRKLQQPVLGAFTITLGGLERLPIVWRCTMMILSAFKATSSSKGKGNEDIDHDGGATMLAILSPSMADTILGKELHGMPCWSSPGKRCHCQRRWRSLTSTRRGRCSIHSSTRHKETPIWNVSWWRNLVQHSISWSGWLDAKPLSLINPTSYHFDFHHRPGRAENAGRMQLTVKRNKWIRWNTGLPERIINWRRYCAKCVLERFWPDWIWTQMEEYSSQQRYWRIHVRTCVSCTQLPRVNQIAYDVDDNLKSYTISIGTNSPCPRSKSFAM